MKTTQQLYEAFAAAFPDIVSEPPPLIRASADSKVGQFKGHKNSVGFLAGYSCSWMTLLCYLMCYTERGQAGMDNAYLFRAWNTWALFAYLLKGDVDGLARNFSSLITHANKQYHNRLKPDHQIEIAKAERFISNAKRRYKKKIDQLKTEVGYGKHGRHHMEQWGPDIHLIEMERDKKINERVELIKTLQEKIYVQRALRAAGPMWRWMWSGDLVDATHAMAVRKASAMHPNTTAWIYTRSFHLLQFLEPVPRNLTVWLSEDEENTEIAQQYYKQFPWARRTTLTNEDDPTPSTGIICPENAGKFRTVIGACAKCKICSHGTKEEVHFINKKSKSTYRRPASETLLQITA